MKDAEKVEIMTRELLGGHNYESDFSILIKCVYALYLRLRALETRP